ncbi:helix-turn-helix transcriptional regulator [Lihuaxuella thermophila]|uniref:Helix-turn-helix n=1 Tax=Lihuaxuella thermophila TaxID=1173111 RepID=A0A1H8CP30_9BACL|nr:helix-turn-helix transcriptional regulator [Lihuaxuella thermophila]SEM96755.1 Helix-turn-helix [Lihuaxuella thermophila]
MIFGLDPSITRYVVRKIRKEKKLRQDDLSDKNMSYGTISNIERGVGHVDEQTIYKYLGKLGLTEKRLKQLVNIEKERINDVTIYLETVESMLDNNKLEEAEKMLKEIQLDRYHPLAPYYTYLEGRFYREKNYFNKAEQSYKLAIRLHKQYNLCYRHNIAATCYNGLGILNYRQNNLEEALYYTDEGLSEFDEDKGGKDIKYHLIGNKILYLINLSQYEPAKQVLDEAWSSISQIDNIGIVLNLYRFKSIILRKMKRYADAIDVCKEGIDIARRNRIQNRYLDLVTVLGSIYLYQKQIEKAKRLFKLVLRYDSQGNFPRSRIDALTYLAITETYENNWTEAEENIRSALEIARDVSQHFRLSKALIVCGNIFAEQEKYKEAVIYYQEAVQLTEKSGYKQRQYSALLQLAYCFDKMALKSDFEMSMRKLLNIQRELNLQSEDELYDLRNC